MTRLTPVSNTPFVTGQYSAVTTLYITPAAGNLISLFDGSVWTVFTFSEISFSVPSTTNTIYDVFLYRDSGAILAEIVAWTDDTTRAVDLVYQDGVLLKSGSVDKRYIGSFRTNGVSGNTQLDNNAAYIWNNYNRCPYHMVLRAYDNSSTVSWSISSTVTRNINNSANYSTFNILCGHTDDYLTLLSGGYYASVSSFIGTYNMGWSIDADTIDGFSATNNNNIPGILNTFLITPNLLGKHDYSLNEVVTCSGGSVTVISSDGSGGFGYQHCMVLC